MNKTFFIADTHFGHEAVINYENRPFKNSKEMTATLINNWNSVVSNEDTVFVLGDFSAYDKDTNMSICKSLNGHKILVMGNHDIEREKFYYECGFESVCKYPIIYDNFWILSHEPMYISSNMPYANIFGHVHGNPIYTNYSKQSFCVSAERINYTPIEFNDIKNKMGINNWK